MISGRTFNAREAKDYALVHYVCKNNSLQVATDQILEKLLSNGPEAMLEIKRMLPGLSANLTADQVQKHTAKIIARCRISAEGQEGINAFFDKRKPYWDESQ
jgi:methylglutaconyl-CoA hydratase